MPTNDKDETPIERCIRLAFEEYQNQGGVWYEFDDFISIAEFTGCNRHDD